MMLNEVLISYLRIFSKSRYENHQLIKDGSSLLDCLAYGFSKLIEEIEAGDDILLPDETLRLLHALDARLTQVSFSSKHWCSAEEWESVHAYSWQVINAMEIEWDSDAESQ